MKSLYEYTTIDKSAWGDGPWQAEPDKVQWRDEATGLPCLAKRGNPHFGNWCGYVGVPEAHPLFKTDGEGLVVHGGITFTGTCDDGPEAETICHIPEPGEPDHVWWFGFDCGHFRDFMPGLRAIEIGRGYEPLPEPDVIYKDLGYVVRECEDLARQLIEAVKEAA
jgi:hypothetical protein